jgi:hypothetical protein
VNIKSVQLVKRLLPLVSLTVGAIVIAITQNSPSITKSSIVKLDSDPTPIQALTTPSPTVAPHVTIDGQAIKFGSGGTADVMLAGTGNDETQVVASNGQINMTTKGSNGDLKASTGMTNNTNVSIGSQFNGGNGVGASSVYGTSTSVNAYGNSSSFSSQQVFSTGSNSVDVTSP